MTVLVNCTKIIFSHCLSDNACLWYIDLSRSCITRIIPLSHQVRFLTKLFILADFIINPVSGNATKWSNTLKYSDTLSVWPFCWVSASRVKDWVANALYLQMFKQARLVELWRYKIDRHCIVQVIARVNRHCFFLSCSLQQWCMDKSFTGKNIQKQIKGKNCMT